jgi:hypothetical protein
MTRKAMRLGGAIGVAHVVVAISGFIIEFRQTIDVTLTAPRENLTKLYVDTDPAHTFLGGHLEMLGFLLLLPFGAALYSLLRPREGQGGFGAMTALLALTAFIATTLSPGFAAGGAALWMGTHGADLSAVDTLNTLRNTTFVTSLAAYAVFFAAIGISALVGRSLPKFLSISALGIAAWLAVGIAFFTDGQADMPAMFGFLWVLAAGIWMLRGKASADPVMTPVAAREAVSAA